MEISILHPHDVTDESIGQLNHLLKQLSADSSGTSRHALETLVEEGGFILCARTVSGEIIGMAQLDRRYNIEGVRVGTIETVVVDEAYRGQGIAQSMIERLINIALQSGVKRIRLTSKPEREAANHLYQKMGFERVETNVYQKILKPD